MSRVLLVGRGPLPSPGQPRTGFAQLRTAAFWSALRGAGHAVDLLLIEDDGDPRLVERGRHLARAADVVVSAGPHRPAAVACAVAEDRPLWVDLPGDPLAELQAVATARGGDVPADRIADAQGAAVRALSRADHVSVISGPQRAAAIGQMGLLGRTVSARAPVSVVPITYGFPLERPEPRAWPTDGPITVALSGAVTPWLDDERLAAALDLALTAAPRLRVAFTGGGVSGHYTAGAERLSRWAADTTHRRRVTWHGSIPHEQLVEVLGGAHVGLCLDRPGDEPTLGSRTRVLLYGWMNMHIAASPCTELVADLAAAGLATALPPEGDAQAVADALLALLEAPPTPDRARRAHAWLLHRFRPEVATAPLLAWVAAPSRCPPADSPAERLAAEVEALRQRLAQVHGSPTWRVLSRLHGRLRRG